MIKSAGQERNWKNALGGRLFQKRIFCQKTKNKLNNFMMEKIKKEIKSILKESPISSDVEHANRTLKWLLILKPDADDALRVAAYGHDIDRGITKITNKDLSDMKEYTKDREEHSLRSAKFISDLLLNNHCDKNFIEKVKYLVGRHEIGGDSESDVLKDADSIAYFDYNIPVYFQRNGEEKTRYKIIYMYDRASKNAQKMIKKLKYSDKKIQKLVQEELNKL